MGLEFFLCCPEGAEVVLRHPTMCTSTLMFVLNTTQPLFVLKPIHTTRQQASLTSCHTPSGATLCHTCSGHAVQVSDSAEEVVHSHEAVLSQVRSNMSATSWLHMCLSCQ